VGGGHGGLGAAILKACPRTSVVVFDQPAVIATAPRHAPEGGAERLRYVAGISSSPCPRAVMPMC
jgi:hypothetical protein